MATQAKDVLDDGKIQLSPSAKGLRSNEPGYLRTHSRQVLRNNDRVGLSIAELYWDLYTSRDRVELVFSPS
jgi:hypothetical protein